MADLGDAKVVTWAARAVLPLCNLQSLTMALAMTKAAPWGPEIKLSQVLNDYEAHW